MKIQQAKGEEVQVRYSVEGSVFCTTSSDTNFDIVLLILLYVFQQSTHNHGVNSIYDMKNSFYVRYVLFQDEYTKVLFPHVLGNSLFPHIYEENFVVRTRRRLLSWPDRLPTNKIC